MNSESINDGAIHSPIRSTSIGMALDMSHYKWGYKNAGKQVGVYPTHGRSNQQWSVVETALGNFILKNRKSGKVLDLARRRSGSGKAGNTQLAVWGKHGTSNQLWF